MAKGSLFIVINSLVKQKNKDLISLHDWPNCRSMAVTTTCNRFVCVGREDFMLLRRFSGEVMPSDSAKKSARALQCISLKFSCKLIIVLIQRTLGTVDQRFSVSLLLKDAKML